jgi:hypothetical protein
VIEAATTKRRPAFLLADAVTAGWRSGGQGRGRAADLLIFGSGWPGWDV